ncbi:hypothetical protein D3C86_900240 [compost metagenome]
MLAVTHALRLQRADAAVEFTGQHRVLTGRDLEIQLVTVPGLGAEMHLGRGEQCDGVVVVLNRITAEAVARNFQSITGGARRQVPALTTAGLIGGNQSFALEFALAVEQVQVFFVGFSLPHRGPEHGQGVGAVRLQVQAAVADIGPTHGCGFGAQPEAETHQQ